MLEGLNAIEQHAIHALDAIKDANNSDMQNDDRKDGNFAFSTEHHLPWESPVGQSGQGEVEVCNFIKDLEEMKLELSQKSAGRDKHEEVLKEKHRMELLMIQELVMQAAAHNK